MGSYVRQQRDHVLDSSNAIYTAESTNQTPTVAQSYYGFQQASSENLSKTALDSGTDTNGFQYRNPNFGRVIPQGEIVSRIVPYWEVEIKLYPLFFYMVANQCINNKTLIYVPPPF
ncbi:9079_t:CDS:2 [Acaulospora colombiana]|uniref:9079_t:CDS:1 n=1 Tax=Acaulospora colombiana TaxID=27376 RepID=A0ACA9JXM7_9GLOM|nr:9079_t:CDS:2 [Acaulospora colombiana]